MRSGIPLAQPGGMTVLQHDHFLRMVQQIQAELRRAAVRLAGLSRAEDLVQETLLRAFAAWHRLAPGTSARAWMHAILRNAFIDEERRRKRETVLDEQDERIPLTRSLDRALIL